MDWKKKQRMAELGHNSNSKKEFFEFCLNNVENFDDQDWMIFADLVFIVPSDMIKDIEFWKEMYPFMKKYDFGKDEIAFRSYVRLKLIVSNCEDKLNINLN